MPLYGQSDQNLRSEAKVDDQTVKMCLQRFLKTLKTAKRTYPNSVYNLLVSSSSVNSHFDPTTSSLSDLDLPTFRQILSDPDVKSSKCVSLFDFILKNPSFFSFQPDLRAHFTLTFRVLSQRRFSDAAKLLKFVAIDEILRYPFHVFAATVDNFCSETKLVAKFFNLMLKVYSDNGKFDEAVEVFEYMKNREVKIDERTCTVHLINLKKCDQVELANDFFNLIVESGVKVSVYSLTVVVCALCGNGEIKRARELVEEMLRKGTKPCIITYKAMIDCCTKRWNFGELDSVLKLMEREGEELNLDTYKILIDGFTSYGKLEEAERLVLEMHNKKLRTETHLYNLIMNGYSRLGLVEKAFELHRKMNDRAVIPNTDTYWVLMSGLCRAGKVDEALSFLCELQANGFEVDEAMYNALTEGCCRKGVVDKALEVLIEMQREGFMPDETVCSEIAKVLSELNRVEAKMVMTYLVKRGVSPKACSNLVGVQDNGFG